MRSERQEGNASPPLPTAEQSYQEAVLSRLTALLDDPVTPFVAPPQVLRILILSYPSKSNNLYMSREIYTFVDAPKFVLGELRGLEKD